MFLSFYLLLCLYMCDISIDSTIKSSNYHLSKRFDTKVNFSLVYLWKNNIKMDSIKLYSDWYGIDSIVKLDELHWNCFYKVRSGVNITNWYFARFAVVNERLVVQLHLLNSNSENGVVLKKQSLTLDSLGYQIKMVSINDSSSYRLKFDSTLNVFYNDTISINEKIYKGIKIKENEYVYINYLWKEYNSSNGYLSDM